MLQNVTKCYKMLQIVSKCYKLLQIVSNCYNLLQFVTICNKLLQIYKLLQIVLLRYDVISKNSKEGSSCEHSSFYSLSQNALPTHYFNNFSQQQNHLRTHHQKSHEIDETLPFRLQPTVGPRIK